MRKTKRQNSIKSCNESRAAAFEFTMCLWFMHIKFKVGFCTNNATFSWWNSKKLTLNVSTVILVKMGVLAFSVEPQRVAKIEKTSLISFLLIGICFSQVQTHNFAYTHTYHCPFKICIFYMFSFISELCYTMFIREIHPLCLLQRHSHYDVFFQKFSVLHIKMPKNMECFEEKCGKRG